MIFRQINNSINDEQQYYQSVLNILDGIIGDLNYCMCALRS